MKTTAEIAEIAAAKTLEGLEAAHRVGTKVGATALAVLVEAMGDEIEYADALRGIVEAALEADRAQRAAPVTSSFTSPREIARQVAGEYGAPVTGRAYCVGVDCIMRDRAQRALDVDGEPMDPLMAAIADALDARGDHGDARDDFANRAAAAVRGEGGYTEVIWDTYIAKFLRDLEDVYGTDERSCSRCGDVVGYLDSRDECDACNNATRCPNCDEDTDEEDGREEFKNWCRSCVHNAERSA